jgi:hypothetical protein
MLFTLLLGRRSWERGKQCTILNTQRHYEHFIYLLKQNLSCEVSFGFPFIRLARSRRGSKAWLISSASIGPQTPEEASPSFACPTKQGPPAVAVHALGGLTRGIKGTHFPSKSISSSSLLHPFSPCSSVLLTIPKAAWRTLSSPRLVRLGIR